MSKKSAVAKERSLSDQLDAALNALIPENESSGTFAFGDSEEESPTFIRYVVTTGIQSFDDRVGGMPIGKSTELCGLPKSGKTNMAVRTCVRAQQGFIYERIEEDGGIRLRKLEPDEYNVTVMYYDNEGSLSDINNRKVDGSIMKGKIAQCETVELLWKTMDKVMEVIDKAQQANPKVIQFLIVVIDTVGSMTTKMEMDTAWGKVDFPRVPMQIKSGFKQMTSRMQRENVMLIGLNHVSRKMALRGQVAFKGWNYDSPGGMSFSYFATHQIYFEMLQRKYCLRGKKGEADGIIIYFLSQKNRMKPMLRQCHMALLLGLSDPKTGKLIQEGGFNDLYTTLETLIYHKAASISKETGAITFYLEKFGIPMTTWGAAATPSLEEGDDAAPPPQTPTRRLSQRPRQEEKKRKDPRIANRLEWPDFYAEHKADMDALYDVVTRAAMMGSRIDVVLPGADGEDDDDNDDETSE